MTDEEAVQFLLDLVSIPSVTGTESEAVRFALGTLGNFGLETSTDSAGNGIGTTAPGERRLMFLGHIDTVPGLVEPRIEGNALYGRGAVDAKGPLATAIAAAIRARSTAGLEVVAGVGEEGPSHGARHLAAQPGPDALIIGEPGGWDSIVLGYKGSMRATIRHEMPVAHSAGQGGTVCDLAFESWGRVKECCRELSPGESQFDQLTPALLSFQSESDGLTARCEMNSSFRLPPGLDLAEFKARVMEAAVPGCVAFAEADGAFRAPRNTGLVSSFVRSIRMEEAKPRFKVKTGTSDMNVVAPVWQCPTVAYGPGDSSLDHTPNEHLAIDEYLRGIRVLTRVFQDWGRA